MKQGRSAFALATAAVAWSVVIAVSAFVLPAYSGESCSVGGASTNLVCTHSTHTLVEVNGLGSMIWFALVGGIALGAWLLLHAKCAFGMPGAAGLAQLLAVPLLVFSAISFGIGLLVAPIPILLLIASVKTPQGAQSVPR
jgi:hypothetical protein